MATVPSPIITMQRYLQLDRQSERPSEYYDGEMFPIAESSLSHVRIQGNLYGSLRERLEDRSCEALLSPLRVRIPHSQKYCYPDLIVACGGLELEDNEHDTLLNPTVLIEILSPSTADFDSGEKFRLYRSIPTFKEYVLVSQDRVLIERFHRQNEKNWHFETISDLDATLRLESIDVAVPMREIYAKVEFPKD